MYDVDSAAALPAALIGLLRPGGRFYGAAPASRGGGGFRSFVDAMEAAPFACLRHELAVMTTPTTDSHEPTLLFYETFMDFNTLD